MGTFRYSLTITVHSIEDNDKCAKLEPVFSNIIKQDGGKEGKKLREREMRDGKLK